MNTSLKTPLSKLMSLVTTLRSVDAEMPLMALQIFVLVATRPGISSRDILRELDLSQSSVSRSLAILSKNATFRKTGSYGFVTVSEDPTDRRNKVAYLTPTGKVFAMKLMGIVTPDAAVNPDELG